MFWIANIKTFCQLLWKHRWFLPATHGCQRNYICNVWGFHDSLVFIKKSYFFLEWMSNIRPGLWCHNKSCCSYRYNDGRTKHSFNVHRVWESQHDCMHEPYKNMRRFSHSFDRYFLRSIHLQKSLWEKHQSVMNWSTWWQQSLLAKNNRMFILLYHDY